MTDGYRFTEGDCHILARRLHRLLGWPLHSFTWDKPSDPNPWPDLHCFVVSPDGRFALDAGGLTPVQKFLDEWKAPRSREFSLKDTISFWGKPEFGHYSYERARVVADKLIAGLANV